MRSFFFTLARRTARVLVALVVLVLAVGFGGRAYLVLNGPQLEPWLTFVPHELTIAELDKADFATYLAAEERAFAEVRANVSDKLPARETTSIDRYYPGSPIYPPRFTQDWNRSFVIEPEGPVKGVAVFVHGLTDSPYSLRHFARRAAALGFVAIGIRMPGHGTVPGGLTAATWPQWLAATRLAMREAGRRAGPDKPIHLFGYSNGAALALMYALDAIDDETQPKPSRLVLLSPMIGITPAARFSWLAGVPAVVPGLEAAAYLSIEPEFNPFKYNSFPVNGAQQSFDLTQALAANLTHHARNGVVTGLPPVLAFQSVLDHTVLTPAVVNGLFARLAPNNNELVLFDLNRSTRLDRMLHTAAENVLDDLLPKAPRPFRTTLIANVDRNTAQVEARVTDAGATAETATPLGLDYPQQVYSLSHIAIPFPLDDGLYGLDPSPEDNFGINLGNIVGRGERDLLVLSLDVLMRMSSNPFFPYMLGRVDEGYAPAP